MNSQVVDPACGLLGVLVAMSLAYTWGVDPSERATKNILTMLLFIAAVLLPSFLFFDWFYNRHIHHLFPVVMVGALYISRTATPLTWYDVSLWGYVVVIHLALRFYCSIGPFGLIELMQELESSRPVGAKGLEGPPP